MSDRGAFERRPRVLYCRGRHGAGCTSSEMVGRHGRLSGAVLCAEFRGQVGGVGGWLVWSLSDRVQSRCGQNGVRCGRLGAPRCRARGALRRVFSVVHGRVRSCAGGVLRMRERVGHSVRAGRRIVLVGVGRASCMVSLGQGQLGELVTGVSTRLVAR
jgi:hypothetical protein